jgi:hypothetical protein
MFLDDPLGSIASKRTDRSHHTEATIESIDSDFENAA